MIAENAITQNPPVRICPLNEVLESSLDHCTQTTASSREFMESKIRKKVIFIFFFGLVLGGCSIFFVL